MRHCGDKSTITDHDELPIPKIILFLDTLVVMLSCGTQLRQASNTATIPNNTVALSLTSDALTNHP